MDAYNAFKSALEQAKRDGKPVAYEKVEISLGEHPNLMDEVNNKIFTEQKGIDELHFYDTAGHSFIILQPAVRGLTAKFQQPNRLANLPVDYTTYTIDIRYTKADEDDYPVIFTWTRAQTIDLLDANGLANKLATDARRLAALTELKSLSLTFQPDTCAQLRASNYFDNQKSLVAVKFYLPHAPTEAETNNLKAIAANQQRRGFTVERDYYEVVVTRDPVVSKKKRRKSTPRR